MTIRTGIRRSTLLPATYDVDNLAGKRICKQSLQQETGLPVVDLPIYGMVCRLTEQKGVHLLPRCWTSFCIIRCRW